MRFPDSHRTLDRQGPQDNPAIGVAGQESQVLAKEEYRVDLCRVASENIRWLGWWQRQSLRDV